MDYAYGAHAEHHRIVDVMGDDVQGIAEAFAAHVQFSVEVEPSGDDAGILPLLPGVLCLLMSLSIEPALRPLSEGQGSGGEDAWYNE